MIYISNDIYLSRLDAIYGEKNRPLIAWKSSIAYGSMSLYPGSQSSFNPHPLSVINPLNIWSPDTYSVIRVDPIQTTGSPIREFFIGFTVDSDVDYVTIVGHNLHETGLYQIQRSSDGSTWTNVTPLRQPLNGRPIIDYFNQSNDAQWRIRILKTGGQLVRVTHVRAGMMMRLQRCNSGDMAPYGLTKSARGNTIMSDSGNYFGSNVSAEMCTWNINQRNNMPDYVRSEIYPFIEHMNCTSRVMGKPKGTFVAAWQPDTYPDETIYAWKEPDQDVTPVHNPANNLMSWSCSGDGMSV